MNEPSDAGQVPLEEPCRSRENQRTYSNWREALMALIETRISLIQLESRTAGKAAGKRAALFGAAGACAFFCWALLLAGGISLISRWTQWPWDLIAITTAVLHLIIGLVLVKLPPPTNGAAFELTRAEFQKDREWIENFNKNKN